jgi:hypothetical protein
MSAISKISGMIAPDTVDRVSAVVAMGCGLDVLGAAVFVWMPEVGAGLVPELDPDVGWVVPDVDPADEVGVGDGDGECDPDPPGCLPFRFGTFAF